MKKKKPLSNKARPKQDSLLLREALATGAVATASHLIDTLTLNHISDAIWGGDVDEILGFISNTVEERLGRLYSPQFVLCGKPRVATLSDVVAKCGPMYDAGATFSFGDRRPGWAVAASNNRILSWTDEGIGLVGDQVVNIDERFITARPLDEFQDTLILGPLDAATIEELPSHMIMPEWKGRSLTSNAFDPLVFRDVFNEAMRQHNQLVWTYDFRSNAAAAEALRHLLSQSDSEEHADPLLAFATISAEEANRELLKKAVERDPSTRHWAEWIDVWIDFPNVSQGRISALGSEDPLTAALANACQTFLELNDGDDVSLDRLLDFVALQRNPESPYLSHILARVLSMCVEKSLEQEPSMDDGGNPDLYAQAIRLGYRGNAVIAWMMDAIRAGETDFITLCLDERFTPVGRFISGGYLNLLTMAATAGNLLIVQAFLRHGANPDEPSHYGGEGTLAFGEQQMTEGAAWSDSIMHALRTARKHRE